MTEKRYTVSGMTCSHCVDAVSTALGAVPGVEDVAVDLSSGQVTVSGDEFTDEQVRAAVDEAGYEVVSA
ncbi:MAG: heavy-metal-associated domain-containing protein [Jatrophihabitantaceae bacterium]